MVAITNILFFALTATASVLPLVERAGVNATANADIKKIVGDLNDLTTATNNYHGGGLQNAIPIQTAYNNLDADIKSATSDANGFPQQDSYTSKYILKRITSFEPKAKALIKAVLAKKDQFKKDGVTDLAAMDIASLKKDADALADALIAKASKDQKKNGQAVKKRLDKLFDEAAADFKN